MGAFVIGSVLAIVIAAASAGGYAFFGITAAEYFSTEYAQLHDEHMPEEFRGEEGQR